MPAKTDITWSQLQAGLVKVTGRNVQFLSINSLGTPAILDLVVLLGAPLEGGEGSMNGVIKALTLLLDAAREAQITANTGQVAGERLNALAAPVYGAPTGNFVPVTRTLVSRADLSSASKIVGASI